MSFLRHSVDKASVNLAVPTWQRHSQVRQTQENRNSIDAQNNSDDVQTNLLISLSFYRLSAMRSRQQTWTARRLLHRLPGPAFLLPCTRGRPQPAQTPACCRSRVDRVYGFVCRLKSADVWRSNYQFAHEIDFHTVTADPQILTEIRHPAHTLPYSISLPSSSLRDHRFTLNN